MPIINNALYAGKDSLYPSSLTVGEMTGHIAKNAIKKRGLLIGKVELKLPMNIGHVKEQNGSKTNSPDILQVVYANILEQRRA